MPSRVTIPPIAVFPVSKAAQDAAAVNKSDFTYGGVFTGAADPIGTLVNGSILTNSEVVAILMNYTNYPSGGLTINTNYQKNPQKTVFLNAKLSNWAPNDGGQPQPGVGNDLVYRDPWGHPYVITMDLNYDDQCNDAFYSLSKVSNPTGANTNPGLNGLVNPDTAKPDNFQYHGKVMVWSAGPDGKIDNQSPANVGVNKDNVLSWK
ncbi:MAG: hypothetical protein WDM76_19265 [Limisphaerales bacterium]